MRQSDVTFRNIVPEFDNVPVEERKEMEIVEISFPDGKVTAFPADAVNPESGVKYRDLYARKYQAFKKGDNSERVAELKSEIASRQAELDGLKKPKDDKRVQENLGYGKKTPDPVKDPVLPVRAADHTTPAPILGIQNPTSSAPVLGQPKHENII